MTDADPVSWLMIEPGWKVVDTSGDEVAHVDDVVGDEERDIFSGLNVSTSLFGHSRFVPAEHVSEITPDRVRIDVAVDELAEHRP
ncbi:MAG: DUF2171 domain-containing protein [Actinobacteria bacterium]|nr:DUF2171 domain-containing protein [Actinomycetota bacterium]MBV8396736.1 DUF2171 domain-containing protein [Actinomycetota bacterium]